MQEPHAGVGVLAARSAAAAPATLRHTTRAAPHPAQASGHAGAADGAGESSAEEEAAASDSEDEEGAAIARLKDPAARLRTQQSRAQAEASGMEVVPEVRPPACLRPISSAHRLGCSD